jgi:hypothetical protein
MRSSSGRASRHEIASTGIAGNVFVSPGARWRAPAIDGQPGVVGSPGAIEAYDASPRWTWPSGPHGPSGNVLPRAKPSLGWIGVQQDRARSCALGGHDLEAAEAVGIGVADQDDLACDRDAARPQHVVVVGIAGVGIDDLGGDIARGRERAVGAGDARVPRGRIGIVGVLAQRCAVRHRGHHLERDLLGLAEVRLVGPQRDLLPALGAPLRGDPARELGVARRGGAMRLGGQRAMKRADLLGRDAREEALLQSMLAPGGDWTEAGDRMRAAAGIAGSLRRARVWRMDRG